MDPVSVRTKVRESLEADLEMPTDLADDIAFHMTDWLHDLGEYVTFCKEPDALSHEEVTDLLARFLAHVPNHMAAAHRLFMNDPLEDVFGIGATAGTGRPDA